MARRRSRSGGRFAAAVVLIVAAGGTYWWLTSGQQPEQKSQPGLTAGTDEQRPITKLAAGASQTEGIPGGDRRTTAGRPGTPGPTETARADSVEAVRNEAERLMAAGDPVAARRQLAAVATDSRLTPEQAESIGLRLHQLADETLFSPKAFAADPLTDTHVLGAGDILLRVGQRFKVTPDLLARINGLPSPNVVRQGQRLKVINGPFHAVVDKSDYDLFVYLQDTLVRHFKVGLGVDGATPTGIWRVSEKLRNPTYYPPRGGAVIAAADPENPLGERWIGLEGIEGDAVGQTGYGIHGTIEPETIGTSMSLGCIRLLNEDVEFLFDLLVRGESTVVIRE